MAFSSKKICSPQSLFLPSLKLRKKKKNSEMTKEEKDQLAHLIVVKQFKFEKYLAKALTRGQENTKMKQIIFEKTIKGLGEHLNKE